MSIVKENRIYYSILIGDNIHNVTGRKKQGEGYILLCIRDHPNSHKKRGYVFEHRVMMEMYLGRYLLPNEIVHHVNEIKSDNRISNLQVMGWREHTSKHHKGKIRSAEHAKKLSKALKERFKNKENHPLYKNIDKDFLLQSLKEYGPTKTAEMLNVSRRTIYNKIKEFNLEESYKK